jgi:hypothetical protein
VESGGKFVNDFRIPLCFIRVPELLYSKIPGPYATDPEFWAYLSVVMLLLAIGILHFFKLGIDNIIRGTAGISFRCSRTFCGTLPGLFLVDAFGQLA